MVGIVILIVGVIAIIYANYQNGRIAHAEGSIKKGESFFSGSSGGVGNAIGGAMEGKVSSYKTPVMLLMIGGIVLVVIGGGMALFCGRKRRR